MTGACFVRAWKLAFFCFTGFLLFVFALSLLTPLPASAQTSCHLITSGEATPEGFGVPWNTLQPSRNLLLRAECGGSSVEVIAGAGGQNQYVYRYGYVWTGSAWQQLSFSGSNSVGNDWYIGSASASLQAPSGATYWVAYVCQWTGSQWKCGCKQSACTTSYWQLQAFDPRMGDAGGGTTSGSAPAGSCLASFSGPVMALNKNYGYNTTKIANWQQQARYDARGGRWESHMNGDYHVNPANRKNTAPIQFGIDWGTNVDGAGRIDRWLSRHNQAPQPTSLCFHGGVVVGTQPLNATWGETKYNGGGYAISINGPNSVVERMRVHNHHDAFVPYRSQGFVYRDNWVSYNRDDCIENDGGVGGTVENNLFDGCFVFYSNSDGQVGGSINNTVTIRDNLIRMEPMPGPPFGGKGVNGDRNQKTYGVVLKIEPDDWDAGTSAKIAMHGNTIALESGGVSNTIRLLKDRVVAGCSNNRILWLGSGSFPYSADITGPIANCFTVVTGSAAKNEWQQKRQQWIDAHPDIPRI